MLYQIPDTTYAGIIDLLRSSFIVHHFKYIWKVIARTESIARTPKISRSTFISYGDSNLTHQNLFYFLALANIF